MLTQHALTFARLTGAFEGLCEEAPESVRLGLEPSRQTELIFDLSYAFKEDNPISVLNTVIVKLSTYEWVFPLAGDEITPRGYFDRIFELAHALVVGDDVEQQAAADEAEALVAEILEKSLVYGKRN
jgi:hypothetical protein